MLRPPKASLKRSKSVAAINLTDNGNSSFLTMEQFTNKGVAFLGLRMYNKF